MRVPVSFTLLGALALGLPLACGGVADADAAGGNGSTPSAGGSMGEGGAGSGGRATTDTGGSESCPPANVARLFPVVGPFWFGPDPGPCSSDLDAATYVYDDGLLASSTKGGGESYVRDGQGRLIEVISDANPATYEYVGDQVLETRTSQDAVYTLDEHGYPLTADVLIAGSSQIETYSYVFENCRLVLRDGPPNRNDRTYGYDAAGHMISITDGPIVDNYDYGCW